MDSLYCQAHLKVGIAQICEKTGWTSINQLAMEQMISSTAQFYTELTKTIKLATEHGGRTQPTLEDVAHSFEQHKISLPDLEEYAKHVEPVPFAHPVIKFPAKKANNLQIPDPNSRELQLRGEHIYPHMPLMYPDLEDKACEQAQAPAPIPQAPRTEAPKSASADSAAASAAPAAGSEINKIGSAPSEQPLTPGKRSRMSALNLPEEATISQYQMSSIMMGPDGKIICLKGRGRKPQPGLPPPPLKVISTAPEPVPAAHRGGDDAEAGKENFSEPPSKESTILKLPLNITTMGDGKSKAEQKSKKKKDKCGGGEEKKEKKKKEKTEKKVKLMIGGEKRPHSAIAESGSTPPAKKQKLKDGKPKEGKTKEGKTKTPKAPKTPKTPKTPKSEAGRKKADAERRAALMTTPTISVLPSGASNKGLKELLETNPERLAPEAQPGNLSPTTAAARKHDLTSLVTPELDMLKEIFPPTDIFNSKSRETSPERLIIAENESGAQEKKKQKRIRMQKIDDTIGDVIKKSVEGIEEEEAQPQPVQRATPSTASTETPRKRGRPKKPIKEKFKSSEFIADDVLKREKDDENQGARSMKSINDTIEAVVRGEGGVTETAPDSTPSTPSTTTITTITTTTSTTATPVKEGKKRKVEKDKEKGVKKKLKAKLQNKGDKEGVGESAQPTESPIEVKPFVSDKYSVSEMKVFEFGEPDSPPRFLERRPSQADKEQSPKVQSPPPPVPPLPPPVPAPQSPFSPPKDVKPIIKSPTPESGATAAASSASPSSATSVEQPLVVPLKIEIPWEKEHRKSRPRDKEHKKDKKEKRRDKEKKKKTKDRDRVKDKDRHKSHDKHHEKKRDEQPTATSSTLKLKIKFGGKDSGSPSSMVVKDTKGHADIAAPLASPTPRLKLVIRQDSASDGGPSSQKKYSSVMSTTPAPAVKTEVRNTPPTLQAASPLPGTPPPPVLSRNSSPQDKGTRSPSPSPDIVPRRIKKEKSPSPRAPRHIKKDKSISPHVPRRKEKSHSPHASKRNKEKSISPHFSRSGKDRSRSPHAPRRSKERSQSPLASRSQSLASRSRSPLASRSRSPLASRSRSPQASRSRSPQASGSRSPPASRSRSPIPFSGRSPLASRSRSPAPRRSQEKILSPGSASPASGGGVFDQSTPQDTSPPRGFTPPPRTPSMSPKPMTPSPKRIAYSSPTFSFSSYMQSSPGTGHGTKSPTPTPKTPSLSPAYHRTPSSPRPDRDHSPPPAPKEKSPLNRILFSSPEHDPSSPLAPSMDNLPEEVRPSPPPVSPSPTPVPVPKPKGKPGRPRLKSTTPRGTASPRGRSPKGRGGKTPKAAKTLDGSVVKSAGRGRPPKAKTLAQRAAMAASAGPSVEVTTPKPKPKVASPVQTEAKEPVPKTPASSPPAREATGKSALDSDSESECGAAASTSTATRSRGTVETETVGSYVDPKTGQQIWICPACKMQDDGTPMIGCDKCDDWYHWVCVDISKEPPEEESWFCPRCCAKAKQQVKPKAKRGRKKKVH